VRDLLVRAKDLLECAKLLLRGPIAPEPGHKIYPYRLRGLTITRPNQGWAMDIAYIAMASGFVYLAVVLDWFSRRVPSWRVSITMEVAFCVETLEDALARHGKPEIFNTDHGSQFTGTTFTGVLIKNAIAISMDGKGAWRDKGFVATAVAQRQIRRGVSASLRQRVRGSRIDRVLPRLLQSPTPTFEP
jgi:transposase InsO family protein